MASGLSLRLYPYFSSAAFPRLGTLHPKSVSIEYVAFAEYVGNLLTRVLQTAFWVFFSIFNIVSDLFLIVVMVINVRLIQTTQAKKIVVMCVFGSRAL